MNDGAEPVRDNCCPSDYSRQRAVVMTNEVPVMVAAIGEALGALPAMPSSSSVQQILVQTEQLAIRRRLHESDCEAARLLDAARAALLAGDAALAASDLRELLATLAERDGCLARPD